MVNDYRKLAEYVQMFSKKEAELIILQSRGGLGKSYSIKEAMEDREHLMLNTHLTPLANYLEVWKASTNGLPIIYEDLGKTFFKSDINVSLFKQLCETSKKKTIHYHTTSKRIGDAPKSFQTTSNVMVVVNEFVSGKEDIRALESRGFWVVFEPTKKELWKKMVEITGKPYKTLNDGQRNEVLTYICSKTETIGLNLRHLIRGFQLANYQTIGGKLDWKNELDQLLKPSDNVIAWNIHLNSGRKMSYKAKEFERQTGKTQRTFYRHIEGEEKKHGR